jgi:hypothetical protein
VARVAKLAVIFSSKSLSRWTSGASTSGFTASVGADGRAVRVAARERDFAAEAVFFSVTSGFAVEEAPFGMRFLSSH